MFCRFCGASIAANSHFCSKCGKRLVSAPSRRREAIVRILHLETPYPYAGLLFLLFVGLLMQPRQSNVDYTQVRLELVLEGETSVPEENIFRHHMSLIVENVSEEPVREIPIDLRVRVEPDQPVEVVSDFLGRRLIILRNGERLPLIVILHDLVEPTEKRRYTIDGIVTTAPPADVTYEVWGEDTDEILASLSASIRREPPAGTGPVALMDTR